MAVSERIKYIQAHRNKGDIKSVSDELSLKYNTVRDIIFGKMLGANGEKVLKKMESIIENRIKRQEKERVKYTEKLKNL